MRHFFVAGIVGLCIVLMSITACVQGNPLKQDIFVYRYPEVTTDVYFMLSKKTKFILDFQLHNWCFIRAMHDEVYGFVLCSDIGIKHEERPFPNFTVIVDAGHGGLDNGAHYFGIAEKDINLKIAKKIFAKLQNENIDAAMTRKEDETLRLYTRPSYANLIALASAYTAADASTKRSMQSFLIDLQEIVVSNPVVMPELYHKNVLTNGISDSLAELMGWLRENNNVIILSIHCNSTKDQSLGYRGIELITATINLSHEYPGYDLMDMDARTSLRSALQDALQAADVLPWRKSYLGDYVVLRETNIPSILLELGYLNNKIDSKILLIEENQNLLAEAIVKGVIRWYKTSFASGSLY